jgi:hypothetical protein
VYATHHDGSNHDEGQQDVTAADFVVQTTPSNYAKVQEAPASALYGHTTQTLFEEQKATVTDLVGHAAQIGQSVDNHVQEASPSCLNGHASRTEPVHQAYEQQEPMVAEPDTDVLQTAQIYTRRRATVNSNEYTNQHSKSLHMQRSVRVTLVFAVA